MDLLKRAIVAIQKHLADETAYKWTACHIAEEFRKICKAYEKENKVRTRIIAAFPGTGKSYYHKQYPDTTLDSDSSNFSWVKKAEGDKTRNPNFPDNYIKHIKENIGKYEFIFVSTHKEVREALLENCIFFYLLYPEVQDKEEFLKRYIDRGNDDAFVKLLDQNWEDWIRECRLTTSGCENVPMCFPFIEEELPRVLAME